MDTGSYTTLHPVLDVYWKNEPYSYKRYSFSGCFDEGDESTRWQLSLQFLKGFQEVWRLAIINAIAYDFIIFVLIKPFSDPSC